MKTKTTQVFSLWDIMTSGGLASNIVMALIFLLGLIAVYIFIERLLLYRKCKKKSLLLEQITAALHQGNVAEAQRICSQDSSPQARIIEKALLRIGRPMSDINSAMQAQGQQEVATLEANLPILATCAGAAPMLGFLGTVIGMIMAFFEISNVTGNISPKLLAEGIYTAMGTTAAGLAVGIPAYILYNLLVGMLDKKIAVIQEDSNIFQDVINKA